MPLLFKVRTGDLTGSHFRIERGKTVGRSRSDIQLKDPNVSGLHAKIEGDSKGQFLLIDQDSNNGILLNGQRVKKAALLPGVVVQLGRIELEVVEVSNNEANLLAPLLGWKDQLMAYAQSLDKEENLKDLLPFDPIICFEFLTGIEVGRIVHFGFGPRDFGRQTLDMDSIDLGLPELAFTVFPDKKHRAIIENQYPHQILLNEKSFNRSTVQDGDILFLNPHLKIKINLNTNLKENNYGIN